LGFKWNAKRIARWQVSYRLIGSQPRKPQRFIPQTVGGNFKNTTSVQTLSATLLDNPVADENI